MSLLPVAPTTRGACRASLRGLSLLPPLRSCPWNSLQPHARNFNTFKSPVVFTNPPSLFGIALRRSCHLRRFYQTSSGSRFFAAKTQGTSYLGLGLFGAAGLVAAAGGIAVVLTSQPTSVWETFANGYSNIVGTLLSQTGSGVECEAGTKRPDGLGKLEGQVVALKADDDGEDDEEDGITGNAVKPVGEPSSSRLLSDILTHLKPDWLLILAIVVITGASAAINIYTPSVIGELVTVVQGMTNPASGPADMSLLNAPALKLLGLFISQGFLTFIDITLVTRLGENLSLRIRRDLYDAILKQDMAFFDTHMQGEVVSRLTQDVAEFKHTFKLVITQGLKCITQVIGSAIQLFRISSSLTLALLSTMPFLYLAMNFYGVFLRRLSKAAKKGDSAASSVAGEAVSNIRTVRAFASEDRELDHYMGAATLASKVNGVLGFHIGLFQALVGVLFSQVIKSLGSAARVFEYVHLEPTIPTTTGLELVNFEGHIEFRDVYFTYPSRKDIRILERFNLEIPVGKVVALCGASGSGKSTVGQLIERFYDPDSGAVLIDNYNIKSLSPKWLREHIGYINQEPILFASSIYENIRYGNPKATRAQVEEAARMANAAGFIESFPKGYETVVGERGVTLSGGQKQRIAIARALLKNPKILILDEATSALDSHSERVVQDALEELMKGRTVLVIAHRLSTIQNADMIVVMSDSGKDSRESGNVVETGTHKELMRKKGAYYRLYQQLSATESPLLGG
ncbi:ATP-binding cassette, sub-B (MDR TAP), member 8 [Chytridiales sp. JEL 0842]|nr:ATP-binding cassette, sub-B (MDR TAP), member 8 [Chytridiales sp. JEL 0842]